MTYIYIKQIIIKGTNQVLEAVKCDIPEKVHLVSKIHIYLISLPFI